MAYLHSTYCNNIPFNKSDC